MSIVQRFAAERSGGSLLAEQRGGSHLSASHPIDRVVHEDDADVFTAIGCMQDLRGTDGGEVAVALVADDDAVGPAAFHASGHGGRASMRGLDVADVEVVIG